MVSCAIPVICPDCGYKLCIAEIGGDFINWGCPKCDGKAKQPGDLSKVLEIPEKRDPICPDCGKEAIWIKTQTFEGKEVSLYQCGMCRIVLLESDGKIKVIRSGGR